MIESIRVLAVAIALAVTGCAATVQTPTTEQRPLTGTAMPKTAALLITASPGIQSSADWQTFRAEWRTAFANAASARGIQFAYLDAESAEQPPGTVLARVSVKDYRYLTSGARYGFGIMTGNAYVNADAQFFEFPGGKSIGTRYYATTSSAWEGVFSAMTDKQLMAISNAMLKDMMGNGPAQSAERSAVGPAVPTVPIANQVEKPTKVQSPQLNDSYSAERYAKQVGCAEISATLIGKGPGYESYSFQCTTGETMIVRCEWGNCREMK